MSNTSASSLRVLLPLLALCACATPRARGGDDYTAFVYAGCSQARYDAGTQYAADVDTALSALTNSAGYTPYANYTSPSAASANLVGLYQCRSDLPAAVCGGCVKSAVTKLASLCNSAAGAAVQLRACFVRYGNDSFLGRQDTTVLFKKCGGEGGGDTGVVAMRDAALGALVAASAATAGDEGSYRAGAAGYVQAMSQCVGDLGAKACTDCVTAASSQLKAGCGYASAGEVYLGKCYARFWSNAAAGDGNGGGGGNIGGGGNGGISGGGAVGGGNGYAYGFVPHTYSDHDESGKTLAIIIGLVAAVALVIVFLSFVRRVGGVGGGKNFVQNR
uniref:Gnk2-homologous domain-containing protein n=1 Tax=Leersia perrieri TaxID=77586 RepID=A0A0D9WNX7_9ORYZ